MIYINYFKISIIFLLGILYNLSSQNIVLKGQVVASDTKTPLSTATIVSANTLYALSDAQGKFEIKLPSYHPKDSIIISYIGYEDLVIELEKLSLIEENILVLTPLKNLLEEVVLEGNHTIFKDFSTQTISKMEVYMDPNSSGDILMGVNNSVYSTNTEENAALTLRGSPYYKNGVFLNAVRLYDMDISGFNSMDIYRSVINTSIIDKTEVYPSCPPILFSNVSGGAINLNTDKIVKNNIAVMLSPIGIFSNMSKPIKDINLQSFINYSTLEGMKYLNKKAFESIHKYNDFNVGMNFNIIKDNFKINYFSQFVNNTISLLNFAKTDILYKGIDHKLYQVINLYFQSSNFKYNVNLGYSYLSNKKEMPYYNQYIAKHLVYASINTYYYLKNMVIGLGTNLEYGFLKEKNSTDKKHYADGYGYLKYTLNSNFSLGIGYRRNLYNNQNFILYNGFQSYIKYITDNEKHKMLWSVGRYYSFNINQTKYEGLLKSYQITLEYYNYLFKYLDLNMAVYTKRDKGRVFNMDIWDFSDNSNTLGLEITSVGKTDYFTMTFSNIWLRSNFLYKNKEYLASNNLSYFIKTSVSTNKIFHTSINLSFVSRPGLLFTPLWDYPNNTPAVQKINSQTYNAYNNLSLSISKMIPFKDFSLLAFGSIQNILDFKNEKQYYKDHTKIYMDFYNPRVFFFGVIFVFIG